MERILPFVIQLLKCQLRVQTCIHLPPDTNTISPRESQLLFPHTLPWFCHPHTSVLFIRAFFGANVIVSDCHQTRNRCVHGPESGKVEKGYPTIRPEQLSSFVTQHSSSAIPVLVVFSVFLFLKPEVYRLLGHL